jgi:diphthine-ammonia ligase
LKVVVHWSGGKDCCTALHKVVEQGHEVVSLVTYIYMEPYIFHSFKVIELQARSLGIPHKFVKITDDRYTDILEALTRFHVDQGVQAIVTGDIDNVPHKRAWDSVCKKLGIRFLLPLWDRPLGLLPGNRYRKRIMNMELQAGVEAILGCVDTRYFEGKWLARPINRQTLDEMRSLVGPWGKGIDISGEPGEYHSIALSAPLFSEAVEITKYTAKRKVVDFGGWPYREGDFLYMDIEEARLVSKPGKDSLTYQSAG